jgi:CpeS-like protein
MTFSLQNAQLSQESLVEEFFRRSQGSWRSERRYYTLKDGETQEVVSFLTVQFLEPGNAELVELAKLHELADVGVLVCGAKTTWESHYSEPSFKQVTGSTIFGVRGTTLYRDRGFATSKPVTAEFYLPEPTTMRLRTEYSGSVFEEEIKLIGTKYRTRQTIISRAGEEQMIGQYLERRIYEEAASL